MIKSRCKSTCFSPYLQTFSQKLCVFLHTLTFVHNYILARTLFKENCMGLLRTSQSVLLRTSQSVLLRTSQSVLLRTSQSVLLRTSQSVLLCTSQSVLLRTSQSVLLRTSQSVLLCTSQSVLLRTFAYLQPICTQSHPGRPGSEAQGVHFVTFSNRAKKIVWIVLLCPTQTKKQAGLLHQKPCTKIIQTDIKHYRIIAVSSCKSYK